MSRNFIDNDVRYLAAIESAATADLDETLSDFAQRVEREAQRRGFYQAKRQVIIGDEWAKTCRDKLEAGELDAIIGKLEP